MLTVVDHPLLKRALTTLRDVATPYGEFRRTLSDVSSILAYEALRDLPVTTCPVHLRECELLTPRLLGRGQWHRACWLTTART